MSRPEPPAERATPWITLGVGLFFAALAAFLFLPVFLFDRMIYGYDVIANHLPHSVEIQKCLAFHELPLWMPDILGGMPGVASGNLSFFYPSDLLSALAGWPLNIQYGLDAAIHVALAGLGMFLFLRRIGPSVSASLLGALCFAVSGSVLSQLFGGYYNFLEGVALLPWIFWAADKGRRESSWFAWGSAAWP